MRPGCRASPSTPHLGEFRGVPWPPLLSWGSPRTWMWMWLWCLTLLGCMDGSSTVHTRHAGDNSDNSPVIVSASLGDEGFGAPGMSSSHTHTQTQTHPEHHHHLHGNRHHAAAASSPVAIYRSPASLRTGHAGTTYIFGRGGGLITFSWPHNERPSTRTDRLTVGFSTSLKDGILVRINSAEGLGDFIMLHIERGKIGVLFNVGTVDILVQETSIPVNDGKYHVVRFIRNGANATLQVDNWPINEHFPQGRALTIFNTQANITIGGTDRRRPFQGQLSGLYYNGLKVLNMAAHGNPNIRINGSVRLVGDAGAGGGGGARTTALPPEMSTTFIETTTTMSTTTTRKHRSPPTIQVLKEKDKLKQTPDEIVSSAECSSDDEDLDECDSGHAGEFILVEDPLVYPPLATRTPFIPPFPTLRPPPTITETTKESLSMATEAGVPCLSDGGSDDCDDGLVISGFGSGEAFDSRLPPTDDEDFYTTFSPVTDKTFSTSAFEGGYKWEAKDFRPNKVFESGRTTATTTTTTATTMLAAAATLGPKLSRGGGVGAGAGAPPPDPSSKRPKLPAGKKNNRELKPHQPDIVLLPLPTSYEVDRTKLRSSLITSPMFRNVPTAIPTEPGVRRVPGASEVVRESSSTTGMVVGIVAAAALCILILLYAMYKYRNRDEGSYQVDETRNYITNSAQSNGAVMKDKQSSSKSSKKKQTDKDKEYYV